MSEVDLTQDPNDFLAQATNPDPADPNGQPTDQPPAGDKPAEEKPEVKPEETPKEEPKADPEQKPAPQAPSADPNGQPKKSAEELQKDWENANKKISELGEAKAKLFKTNLSLVNKNPDLIKDVHEDDPELAVQIIKEKWGYDSYDELMAHARIEEMKESDPDSAKREEELLKVKKDNERILKQLRGGAEEAFYTQKGIQNNPFDPKYQAVQEALKKVSPDLLKDNYAEALNLAHIIAFPARTEDQIIEDQKKIALAKGATIPEAKGTGSSPPSSSKLSEAQQGFASAVGANVS
uniref:Uncharacterized protein n=1 Tax=viral metagenome TaxID=1070528 RepID=A0A6H1ZR28_9ZZZZ